MLWLPLAFLTALSESLKDVFGKFSLQKSDVYIVGLALRLFSLPFLLPILFIIEIPVIKPGFYTALISGGLLNILVTVLYMKAIKHSDLSVTVPFLTFTPLFLLITSPIMIGEIPKPWGFGGILMIVLGAYIMNLKNAKKSFAAPFKMLIRDKGPRYMLAVAFIWSITANFDKIGILNSSPMFWVISISVFLTIGMLILVLIKSGSHLHELKTNYKSLLPVGAFAALSLIFQMYAITLSLVAYVIAIKRTSALMSVVFGRLFFKEKDFGERIAGTVLMLIGVLIIALMA